MIHGEAKSYRAGCRCDECRKAMWQHRKEKWKPYHKPKKPKNEVSWRNSRASLAAWLDQLKETTPCADCGGFFPPCAMDFDHLPGTEKIYPVAWFRKNSTLEKTKAEVEKCELVCANCHRVRTKHRREAAQGKTPAI